MAYSNQGNGVSLRKTIMLLRRARVRLRRLIQIIERIQAAGSARSRGKRRAVKGRIRWRPRA